MSGVPQILAIGHIRGTGALILTKRVRAHLGLRPGEPVSITSSSEVTIRTHGAGTRVETGKRCDLELPPEVSRHLGIGAGSLVALVERPDGVALKAVSAVEELGERARPSSANARVSRCGSLGGFSGARIPQTTSFAGSLSGSAWKCSATMAPGKESFRPPLTTRACTSPPMPWPTVR